MAYKNKEKNREYQKEYHKKWNKDNLEKIRLNSKKYYKNNKEKQIQVVNEYNRTRDSGLYLKYKSMVSRCKYPSAIRYHRYGGRGIKCLWKTYKDFKNDMYDSYIEHLNKYGKKQTSLDRIDNNGNYCKDNCRWATVKEQCNNMEKNIFCMYDGKKTTALELSNILQLSLHQSYNVIKQGYFWKKEYLK